jgi:hypothetical protein
VSAAGRRPAAFLVAACSLVMALAACGANAGTRTGNGTAGGAQAFTARARQVLAQWARSPVARAWRSGMVLLSPDELTAIPRTAGFASQRQKEEFAAGRFTLGGTLPSAPLTGRVRWAAGTTATVPLLTAQATFRQLASRRAATSPSPPPGPRC